MSESVHAYVDESERPGRYLMCSVVIEPNRLGELRRTVRHLLLPGQSRLHFKKESVRRRRELATALLGLGLDVSVFESRSELGRNEAEGRALCLAAIIEDIQARGTGATLILESRHHQDVDDYGVIDRARRSKPPLTYEHVDGDHDPLLWLPDSFAWLVGARGDWRRRVEPTLTRYREVG